MPTAAEKNALYFLAAVALVGGGARAVANSRFSGLIDSAEHLKAADTGSLGDRALTAQIAAADSARSARGRRSARKPPKSAFKPPKPDSSFGAREPTISSRIVPPRSPLSVDLNRATQAELERLPRVGPALARRIIARREQHGPYRSLDDLRHVRGIGPSTLALLAPVVTF